MGGSATLSMAYAGSRLGRSILAGLSGRRRVECAYVASTVEEGFPYFTSKVVFGQKGVEKVLPVGTLNDYEKGRMEERKTALKAEIETGSSMRKQTALQTKMMPPTMPCMTTGRRSLLNNRVVFEILPPAWP